MSVVAYRDGVMACDARVTAGGLVIGSMIKVRRFGDGKDVVLCGAVGDADSIIQFFKYVESGMDADYLPSFGSDVTFSGMTVDADSNVYLYYNSMNQCEVTAPYYAIGSGDEVAMGAMYFKSTAIDAVKAACAHTTTCGGPIYAISLDNPNIFSG